MNIYHVTWEDDCGYKFDAVVIAATAHDAQELLNFDASYVEIVVTMIGVALAESLASVVCESSL